MPERSALSGHVRGGRRCEVTDELPRRDQGRQHTNAGGAGNGQLGAAVRGEGQGKRWQFGVVADRVLPQVDDGLGHLVVPRPPSPTAPSHSGVAPPVCCRDACVFPVPPWNKISPLRPKQLCSPRSIRHRRTGQPAMLLQILVKHKRIDNGQQGHRHKADERPQRR